MTEKQSKPADYVSSDEGCNYVHTSPFSRGALDNGRLEGTLTISAWNHPRPWAQAFAERIIPAIGAPDPYGENSPARDIAERLWDLSVRLRNYGDNNDVDEATDDFLSEIADEIMAIQQIVHPL